MTHINDTTGDVSTTLQAFESGSTERLTLSDQ